MMKPPLGSKKARTALLTAFVVGFSLCILSYGISADLATGGQVWGREGITDIVIVLLNFLTPTNIVIISVFVGVVALFAAE